MRRVVTAGLAALLVMTAGCGTKAPAPAQETEQKLQTSSAAAVSSAPEKAAPAIDVAHMPSKEAMQAAIAACGSLLDSLPDAGADAFYMLSREQFALFLDRIEQAGAPVVVSGEDLRGYEQIEAFCEAVKAGEDVQTGVFTVSENGFTLLTLAQNKGRQMTCVTSSAFPGKEIIEGPLAETSGITLTDNGYLLYGKVGEDGRGGAGFRVLPLGEENRAAYRTYVQPIFGCAGKLTDVSWSEADMAGLDLPYVLEALYPMEEKVALSDAGYPLNSQVFTYAVPQQDVERIMMKYLPVTQEQLRGTRGYDAAAGVYRWGCSDRGGSTVTGEVTGIRENADGSKTLTVNRVDLAAGLTKAGEFVLTVMENEDGTFRYLSNALPPQ